MTRDILNPLTANGKAKVLQYVGVGVSHPISAFSDKGEQEIKISELSGYSGSNFEKRCFCQDINKTALEYLVAKKSDYLLIDLLSVRLNMYKKNNHYMVCGFPYVLNKEKISEDFDLNSYELVTPYDFDIDIWRCYVEKFCNFISRYYTPDQIILHECFGTTEYFDDQLMPLKSFSAQRVSDVNNYNNLVKQINAIFLENINGCHVIKFCGKVIADKANVLGLHPLHYEKSYYEYGARALEIICTAHSDNHEAKLLNDLNMFYSEKFELIHAKLELKNKLFWANNALNFTRDALMDIFGNERFAEWLKEQCNKKSRISVLVSKNVAGQILLKALSKYDIKPIFVSPKINFDGLSDDEFELCRQSDIVVCADVHRKNAPERDGVRAVMIAELLEDKKEN